MTRLKNIKSNAFLLGLNMNNATKEQKIQWLCQIIENETEKPEDEIDFALIEECSAYLRELSDTKAEATQEQKKRILKQIKAHHNQTAKGSAKVFCPMWKSPKRIIALAATLSVLLAVSTLSIIANIKGYSNAWEFVVENIQKIPCMHPGDKVNDGEITLIKNDGVMTYNSIEELMQTEGYDILYPSKLPDVVRITKITQQIIDENHIVYSIHFTDVDLSIAISTQMSVSLEDLQQYQQYETGNFVFYIEKISEHEYQAIAHRGKYEYIVFSNQHDVLMTILDGMRGLEK